MNTYNKNIFSIYGERGGGGEGNLQKEVPGVLEHINNQDIANPE